MGHIFISITVILISTIIQFPGRVKYNVFVKRCLSSFVLLFPVTIHYFTVGDLSSIGFQIPYPLSTVLYTSLLSILTVMLNGWVAKREENWKVYPQVRAKVWTASIVFWNTFSLFVYLVSYEILFRGYLQFLSVDTLGFWPAALINVALYAAAHLPKGMKETLLCVPFGMLLVFITWHTQSFLSAVIIHLSLSLSNEFFSIRANPNMRMSFGSSKN